MVGGVSNVIQNPHLLSPLYFVCKNYHSRLNHVENINITSQTPLEYRCFLNPTSFMERKDSLAHRKPNFQIYHICAAPLCPCLCFPCHNLSLPSIVIKFCVMFLNIDPIILQLSLLYISDFLPNLPIAISNSSMEVVWYHTMMKVKIIKTNISIIIIINQNKHHHPLSPYKFPCLLLFSEKSVFGHIFRIWRPHTHAHN